MQGSDAIIKSTRDNTITVFCATNQFSSYLLNPNSTSYCKKGLVLLIQIAMVFLIVKDNTNNTRHLDLVWMGYTELFLVFRRVCELEKTVKVVFIFYGQGKRNLCKPRLFLLVRFNCNLLSLYKISLYSSHASCVQGLEL